MTNSSGLIEHWDRVAENPGTIRQIRYLILEMALRGRLVPQDPRDAPATELIGLLASAQRHQAGAGKRVGNVREDLNTDDLPTLPASWTWCALGTTGKISSGNSVNSTEKQRLQATSEGRPYIATKDVGYGRDPIDYDNELKVPFDDSTYRVARPNTILICSEGGSAGRKIGLTDREVCFGNKLLANQVREGIDPRYIFYLYQSASFYQAFASRMQGIIGGISKERFLGIPIPIPPTAEQHRIVKKVDELMALCDQWQVARINREATRDQLTTSTLATLIDPVTKTFQNDAMFALDILPRITARPEQISNLRKSILLLAVQGKLSLDSVWPKNPTALGKVAKLQNGYAFKSEWFTKTGIRLLRNKNVGHGALCWDDHVCLPESEEADFERFRLREGDIVLTMDRPFIATGTKVARVAADDLPSLLLQRVGRFQLSTSLSSDYLFLWLNSSQFSDQVSPGRSNGVPHISSKQVEAAVLFVPAVDEQQRIVAKVDTLMEVCDQLEASLAKNQEIQTTLLSALLAEAMEARVIPASKLEREAISTV